MSYKGILFDLDGVLIDSESAIEEIFRRILKAIGNFNLTPELYIKYFLGRTDAEGLAMFQKDYPAIPVNLVDKHKEPEYRGLIGAKIVPYPGVLDILQKAKQAGILALVTSSMRWQVEALEQIIPINAFFPIITTADEISRSKPDPEIYQITLKKLGLSAGDCLAIEDTANGVRSAKAAGLTCWAVEHTTPKIELKGADKIFERIGDINFIEAL